jgi:THO complex subunit 3
MSTSIEAESAKLRKRFEKVAQRDLSGHKKRVLCLAWNRSGDKLASGSIDTTIRVYPNADRRHAKDSLELTGHGALIGSIAFSPIEEDTLASTSSDKTLRIWDARAGKERAKIDVKGEGSNVSWSPDGTTILCGGRLDQSVDYIAVVDARVNKVSKILKFGYAVNQFAWLKEGDRYLVTTGAGDIELRGIKKPYEDLKVIKTVHANSGAVFSISMGPDGSKFATGSADSLVNIWDTKELVTLRTVEAMASLVRSVAISHDGQLVASCGQEDNFIDISYIESGETVATVKTDSSAYHLAWHPKRHLLAYCVDEKGATTASNPAVNVKIWGVDSR